MRNLLKNSFRLAWCLFGLWLIGASCMTVTAKRIYVRAQANGNNNGTSWQDAYTDLMTALGDAAQGDEIWVATGTYKPHSSDRTVWFRLMSGWKMYGGFTGIESELSQRPNESYSILSGDIGNPIQQTGNLDDGGYNDNSHHVIGVPSGMSGCILDGFIIEGGNAVSGMSNENGAGLLIEGQGTFSNLIVRYNKAARDGGGIYFSPGNTSTVSHSVSHGNRSVYGGGVYISSGKVFHMNIYDNTASNSGGGILMHSGLVANSVIHNNTCTNNGGAIWMYAHNSGDDHSQSVGNTIYNNTASTGGGIYTTGHASDHGLIANTIIYGNTASSAGSGHETYNNIDIGLRIHNVLIKGTGASDAIRGKSYSGDKTSNLSFTETSPFLSTDRANSNFMRLKSNSQPVNAGNNSHVPSEVTVDLDGNGRIQGNTVDIGAYENLPPGAFVIRDLSTQQVIQGTTIHLPEDKTAPHFIASFSATDPEGGNATISLAPTSAPFIMENDILFVNTFSLDFEETPSYNVVIQASDGAVVGSLTLTIQLTDVNETPTGLALSADEVQENSSNGQVIGILSATDPEGQSLTYTLKTSGTPFAVVGNELRVAGALDYETKNSYAIELAASDGTHEITLSKTISVLDVNETPTGLALSADEVQENSSNGHVVGTLSATDPEGQSLTYTLKTSETPFAVVGSELRVAGALDYETKNSYNIELAASDGTHEITLSKTINILDVNEAPTGLALSADEVQENSSTGQVIGTLSTSDPENQSLTYTLKTGGTPFAVVGNELRVAGALDYETKNSYAIELAASDGTHEVTLAKTISILNVNEAPINFVLSSSEVAELSIVGTVVGTLSATDPEGQSLTYTLKTSGTPFAVVGNELRVAGALDYETKNSYAIELAASDGTHEITLSKTISILNVNEAPTGLALSADEVQENSSNGHVIGTLSASDPENQSLTYTLKTSGTPFAVVGNELRVAGALDYETKNSYAIELAASDGTHEVTLAKTISILNVNEAPTGLALSANEVQENSSNGHVIGILSATDPEGQSLTYTLKTSGTPFAVVGNELRVAGALDYEAKNSYAIELAASDGTHEVTLSKTISVLDVNEAPSGLALSANEVQENSSNGQVIGTLSATDPENQSLTYTLKTSGTPFAVVESELRVAGALDYETKNSYAIELAASDGTHEVTLSKTISILNVNEAPTGLALSADEVQENSSNGHVIGILSATDPEGQSLTYTLKTSGTPFVVVGNELRVAGALDYEAKNSYAIELAASNGAHEITLSKTISVLDVNEAPTGLALSADEVQENSANGQVVGILSASDPENQSLTYTLKTSGTPFAVVGNELRVAGTLDYETKNSYAIELAASDGTHEVTLAKTISILDVNEAPTGLALSADEVQENSSNGHVIGILSAADPEGQSLTYTLKTSGTPFAVVGNELRVAGALDYETKNSYAIELAASDGTHEVALTKTINILDVNEAPTGLALSADEVQENSSNGQVIGTLSATDPENQSLTYTLKTSGTPFAVVGNELRVAGALDYETKNSYAIELAASDGTHEVALTKTINILDVNEAPTGLALSANEVAEGEPEGTRLGYLNATDPEGGSLTYRLETTGVPFAVVGNEVRTSATLDYETKNSYDVEFSVSDGVHKVHLNQTLLVLNVDELPSGFSLSGNEIEENRPAGSLVGTLGASDPDGAPLSYRIVNSVSAFVIDGNTLRTTKELDYETQSQYQLELAVSDGANEVLITPTIFVIDFDELPINFSIDGDKVYENKASGALVGTLSATDPEGKPLVYSLETTGVPFTIVDSALRTTASLNYENTSSYRLILAVSDGVSKVNLSLDIRVLNENEAPIDFTLSKNEVEENKAVGHVVGTLSATDPDGESLQYSLKTTNVPFEVVGGALRTKLAFDYETKNSYPLTLAVTDGTQEVVLETTVSIVNVNEIPVGFAYSGGDVEEDKPVGSTIGRLSATDPDGGAISYRIANEVADFVLAGAELRTARPLNYEAKSSYTLDLRASDGTHEVKIEQQINLIDINEPPIAFALSKDTLSENKAKGLVVGLLSATDPDGGTLTYSLTTTGVPFEVKGDSLCTTEVLDYEENDRYSLTFSVTDGTHTVALTRVISVLDVNEPPTNFRLSTNQVEEGQQAGTVVASLVATDPEGKALSYRLETTNVPFEVVSNTLKATQVLDYEQVSSYPLDFVVTDGVYEVRKSFQVKVLDTNEAPTGFSLSHASIAENKPPSSVVGELSASDPDGDALTYRLVTQGVPFAVVGNSLQTTSALDYETASSYSLTLSVSDGTIGILISPTITVLNTNEPPEDLKLSANQIEENSPLGAVVGELSATDPEKNTLTYHLKTTGVPFEVVGNQLKTTDTLDYETKTRFTLDLEVSDGTHTLAIQRIIEVLNVNEVPTRFALSGSEIAENKPSGTLIGTLSALDAEGAKITYQLKTPDVPFEISGNRLQTTAILDYETKASYSIELTASDGTHELALARLISVLNEDEAPIALALDRSEVAEDASIGVQVGTLSATDPEGKPLTYSLKTNGVPFAVVGSALYVTDALDYETHSSYEIVIAATDGTHEATITKILTILDVNEAPVGLRLSNSAIEENKPSGTVVGLLSATDPEGKALSYSLQASAAPFALVGKEVRSTKPLDYEQQSVYSVILKVSDGTHEVSITQRIQIGNIDEVPRDFGLSGTQIAENKPIGTSVGKLSATDPDGKTLIYQLETKDVPFEVVGDQLKTTAILDYEAKASYSLTLKALDDVHEISMTQPIEVLNVNEPPKSFEISGMRVGENKPSGTKVGVLSATDPDGKALTYRLETKDVPFVVVGDRLKTTAVLDYEAEKSYTLVLKALDDAHEVAISANIEVINENEAPTGLVISKDTLQENKPVGFVIGKLYAKDPEGVALRYSLDPETVPFELAGDELRATAILDHESKANYDITLKASDGTHTVSAQVTILVLDVNEPPTSFVLSADTIAENRPEGALVATLRSIDPEEKALHYRIESDAPFKLVGDELRTKAPLDYEKKAAYQVKLVASDQVHEVAITATISVTDVNEQPFALALSTNQIGENKALGTVVGILSATDPENQKLSYSLETKAIPFEVRDNRLHTKSVLDYEKMARYPIRWAVSDGTHTIYKRDTLWVLDANEVPRNMRLSADKVMENKAEGTLVGLLSATDPEKDTLSYELETPAPFEVAGHQLRTTARLNYEAKSYYALTFKISDGKHAVYQADTVYVMDENEAPVQMSISTKGVNENQPVGTQVGKLSAKDPEGIPMTYTLMTHAPFKVVGDVLQTASVLDYELQNQYVLHFLVSDGVHEVRMQDTVWVVDENEVPSSFILSKNTLKENEPAGSVVGVLDAKDPEGAQLRYKLVTHGVPFEVVGKELRTASGLNYEAAAGYSLTLEVSDGTNKTEIQVHVKVIDVNEAPVGIKLNGGVVNEHVPQGTTVGIVELMDEDLNEAFVLELLSSQDTFEVSGNKLRVGRHVPDYEAQSIHRVRLRAKDRAGHVIVGEFRIVVKDLNESPRNLRLLPRPFYRGDKEGTLVGLLDAVDPDHNTKLRYGLINSENMPFAIISDSLVTTAEFPTLNETRYELEVRVDDGHYVIFKSFTIEVKRRPVTLSTGIRQQAVEIYPNPTIEGVWLKNLSPPVQIRLYNLNGALLYHKMHQTDKVFVDLYNEPLGIYIVEMVSRQGTVHYRVIKGSK